MLTKIISGGQTGADQAALYAAEERGLETGGYMPKDYKTEVGSCPKLAARFGLREHRSSLYSRRTWDNVQLSDATMVFGILNSPGSALTRKYARQLVKPLYLVHWSKHIEVPEETLSAWIDRFNISVLNIAGNRESKNPGIFNALRQYLLSSLPKGNTP